MKKRILFFALCAVCMTAGLTSCTEDDSLDPSQDMVQTVEQSTYELDHGDQGDSPPQGDD